MENWRKLYQNYHQIQLLNKSSELYTVRIRGETIHRIYDASRYSGHDSVHDSFSLTLDMAWFTKWKQKLSINCQLHSVISACKRNILLHSDQFAA